MNRSEIKLDEFNNCPGAQVVKDDLYRHRLLPYLQVVDLDDTYAYTNEGDTLVLAITDASMVNIALALGALATQWGADEFTWRTSEDTYIVRLWWD